MKVNFPQRLLFGVCVLLRVEILCPGAGKPVEFDYPFARA